MPNINITVRNKIASYSGSAIVCYNNDYNVVFDFDSEWDQYETKTMIVRYGKHYQEVIFDGVVASLPVIENQNYIFIGVYAGDIKTTTSAKITCLESIKSGLGCHVQPGKDVYNEIMKKLNERGSASIPTVNIAPEQVLSQNPLTASLTEEQIIILEDDEIWFFSGSINDGDFTYKAGIVKSKTDENIIEAIVTIYTESKNPSYAKMSYSRITKICTFFQLYSVSSEENPRNIYSDKSGIVPVFCKNSIDESNALWHFNNGYPYQEKRAFAKIGNIGRYYRISDYSYLADGTFIVIWENGNQIGPFEIDTIRFDEIGYSSERPSVIIVLQDNVSETILGNEVTFPIPGVYFADIQGVTVTACSCVEQNDVIDVEKQIEWDGSQYIYHEMDYRYLPQNDRIPKIFVSDNQYSEEYNGYSLTKIQQEVIENKNVNHVSITMPDGIERLFQKTFLEDRNISGYSAITLGMTAGGGFNVERTSFFYDYAYGRFYIGITE